jgi:hypothetical protein
MVWGQDDTLFVCFSFFITYIHSIHLSVANRRGLSPSPHRFKAHVEKPPCGAKPRIEVGLPYSKIELIKF